MMQRVLYVGLGAIAGYTLFVSFAALGFAAVVVSLLTPLPAAYVGMRLKPSAGVLAVALTALLVLVTNGQSPALIYLIQFGVPAAVLPWLLQREVAWDRAAVIVVWAMVAASLGGLFVASLAGGQTPFATIGDLIGKEISQTAAAMQEMFAAADIPAEKRHEVGQAVERMVAFLQKAYPGIAITVSGLMTLAVVFLLSVLARGRYVIPGKTFAEWKAPESLVWVLILSGFVVAFDGGMPGVIALNLLVITLPVYFLQGLAVTDCFFRRKSLPPVFRAVGYLLLTLINPLPIVVTGIGVFDLWADFRKPKNIES